MNSLDSDNDRSVQAICTAYDWVESYSIADLVRTVLSHNSEPSTLQAASVAAFKESIDLAHERITHDIDNLEDTSESLRARRHILQQISIQYARVLSKFRCLPNEILCEIFLYTYEDERYRVGRREEGPWKLKVVCRKWARIVEGCSQLWSNMVIHITGDQLRPAAFAQALQFCGSRTLHMTLSTDDLDYVGFEQVWWEKLDHVFHIISSSSERWEALNIKCPGGLVRAVLKLFPLLERGLPLLRSLKLEGSEFEVIPMDSPKLSTLFTSPLLEIVHMDLYQPDDIAQLFNVLPIPSQQIRQLLCYSHFYDDEYEPATLYGRLSLSKGMFPLLKRCIIISTDTSKYSLNPSSASRREVSHRVEHDGVLHFVSSHADVLDAFAFPSLRTFSIGGDEKPDNVVDVFDYEISGLVFKRASDMLLASRCSLVSLVMAYSFTLVDEFLRLLESIPTLQMLELRVTWYKGEVRDNILCSFFTALGNRKNDSTFSMLPALQDLRLSIMAPEVDFPASAQSHDLRFISRVFEAITERSKSPSDFRVFSFTLSTDNMPSLRLDNADIYRLQNLELTQFFLKGSVTSV